MTSPEEWLEVIIIKQQLLSYNSKYTHCMPAVNPKTVTRTGLATTPTSTRRGRGRSQQFEERKLEVVNAAWRVMVRDGLDALSLRSIAHEMGTTTGIVTHYFRDKADLLLVALEQVAERASETYSKALKGPTSIARLERYLHAAMPLEPVSQERIQVWHAFVGHAIGKPNLLEAQRQREEAWRGIIASEIAALQGLELIRADLEPLEEAGNLITIVDGIGLAWMIHPERLSVAHQKKLLRRVLHAILTAPE
jgi:AcrR family transcriptional regulator